MDKQFDFGTKISANRLRRWIITIEGDCPKCGSNSLIKYVDYEVTIGCLVCSWRENESIDRSIQKAFDDIKQTLERIIRTRKDLEDISNVIRQYRERVDSS